MNEPDILERAEKSLYGISPKPWTYLEKGPDGTDQIVSDTDTGRQVVASVTGWFNTEFIIEARELVPLLIAEVRRLRKHFTGICPKCGGEPEPLEPADSYYFCPNCKTYYEDSAADWDKLGKGKHEQP